jgi:hypothetical protein
MARRRHRLRILVLGGLALLAAWAFLVEPSRLVTREATLALPRWPAALAGLRIAALSDRHVGAGRGEAARLERIVAATNAARPDLIVLLGDHVRGTRR